MHLCTRTFTLRGPLNLIWPILDHWGCTHLAPVLAFASKNSIVSEHIAYTVCYVSYQSILNYQKHRKTKAARLSISSSTQGIFMLFCETNIHVLYFWYEAYRLIIKYLSVSQLNSDKKWHSMSSYFYALTAVNSRDASLDSARISLLHWRF